MPVLTHERIANQLQVGLLLFASFNSVVYLMGRGENIRRAERWFQTCEPVFSKDFGGVVGSISEILALAKIGLSSMCQL